MNYIYCVGGNKAGSQKMKIFCKYYYFLLCLRWAKHLTHNFSGWKNFCKILLNEAFMYLTRHYFFVMLGRNFKVIGWKWVFKIRPKNRKKLEQLREEKGWIIDQRPLLKFEWPPAPASRLLRFESKEFQAYFSHLPHLNYLQNLSSVYRFRLLFTYIYSELLIYDHRGPRKYIYIYMSVMNLVILTFDSPAVFFHMCRC